MKPIIIEVKDNKIIMDVSEFRKHIEDAYQQGYRDAGSLSTVTYNNPYWWRDLTCAGTITCTDAVTGADPSLHRDLTCAGTIADTTNKI